MLVSSVLLIIYFLLFSILSWRQLHLAVILVVVLLPSYLVRFELFKIPMTMLEGMILVVFFVFAIKKLRIIRQSRIRALRIRNVAIKTKALWIGIALFLVAATISIFISPDIRAALGIWKAYFIEPILFFIVFIQTINLKRDFRSIFGTLAIIFVLISIYAIWQKFTAWGIPNQFWQAKETRRVTSVFPYPNALGLYLGPIVVLYFGLLLQVFRQIRSRSIAFSLIFTRYGLLVMGYFITVALGLLAVVFAVSEGALFGILSGILFLLFFYKKGKQWKLCFMSFIMLVVLIVLAIPISRSYLLTKIQLNDFSGKVRTEMWKETLNMLQERPLFGAGLGGFQEVFTAYHNDPLVEVYLYPHNFFLNFYTETGLLGLVAIIWIMLVFFWYGLDGYKKNERQYSFPIILMAVMVEIFVHGLVDVPYFKNDLSMLFWFFVFLMVLLREQKMV